ncbi:MAG: hypothetical protein WAV41_02430 [Microgenomates group bacterium]
MKKYLNLFLFFTFYFLLSSFSLAFTVDRQKSVNVSASIDENHCTIYGFTSPNSRVELSNPQVFDVTYSGNNGYYEFNRLILPKNPSELCLTAIDDNNRHTNPTCFPPPPPVNYYTNIGPIILPPTVTINDANIRENSTVAASGQSIPFSPINIYLYQVNAHAPIFAKPAQAFGLPVFTTTTDEDGNYDLNIPTSLSSDYRLFSTVQFATLPSPKSNTILYTLPAIFNLYIYIPLFIVSLLIFAYVLYLYFYHPIRYLPAIYRYPIALPFIIRN